MTVVLEITRIMFYTFGLVSWSLVDYLERKIKSRKCTALLVRTNFFFTLTFFNTDIVASDFEEQLEHSLE